MVGFLRRKSTNKNQVTDAQATVSASDVPPALPPLFHGRTSKSSASHHAGPEPEVPSLPGPLKADDGPPAPALLSGVTTALEDDVDWQALIQFIDAPTLLADKPTRDPTPPPPAEKKLPGVSLRVSPRALPDMPTPGAALVTSNRYLSQAQKARLTREQNEPRPKGEPLALLPLLPSSGSLKNSASNGTLMSTSPIASDSLLDRRHGLAAPHMKEDPQGRVAPDPGLPGASKAVGLVRLFFSLLMPPPHPEYVHRAMLSSKGRTHTRIGRCRAGVGTKVGVPAHSPVPMLM